MHSRADYLWVHMAGLYGHRWVSAYGDDPRAVGAKEWALTLQDMSREQLDVGLEACRKSGEDWPPSAPAFRARCFGIPSFEFVKADLVTRRHLFTRMVWESLDLHLLSMSSQHDADRMVRGAYDYTVARRLDGAPLPAEPAAAIEHEKPVFVPASEEARRKAREAVDAALGRRSTQEDGDPTLNNSVKDPVS